MRILIICTGNSCRSQMAEGFLKSYDHRLEVFSAGTKPSNQINHNAIAVMKEVGIDISNSYPQHVNEYLDLNFDYVITVCNHAKEICPVFHGNIKKQLHIGFDDPFDAVGTEDEILSEYRRVRDEIDRAFKIFAQNHLGIIGLI